MARATDRLVIFSLLAALGCGSSSSDDPLACHTESGTGCWPSVDRVNLATPSFTDPTKVTNTLLPAGALTSVLQVGTVDGKPFRAEVTLLPTTRTISWAGMEVVNIESQYVAYLDGELHEVAIDWYAQADDGSVWYFGEDVFNYEDGVLADTEGTWLAGRDGTAAMIMPANPQVGNVYRPENIADLVFEEVRVKSVGVTGDGPRGPVTGAIIVDELHMDGAHEEKTFAPGYGELYIETGGDVEETALAVPTDALSGAPPAQLATLEDKALAIFDLAGSGNWTEAATALATMKTAWSGLPGSPPLLAAAMERGLAALDTTVTGKSVNGARAAALDVAQATLDLELRHLPQPEIDLSRIGIWAGRVVVDAAAGSKGRVKAHATTLKMIRARCAHTLAPADVSRLDAEIATAVTAASAGDMTAASAAAARLRQVVETL